MTTPRLLVLCWIAALVPALLAIEAYQATPGSAGTTPPEGKPSGKPRLLVFLHPRCPCSKATLAELKELLAEFSGTVNTEVYFALPAEADANWEQTPLRNSAAQIPGVQVRTDAGGAIAKQLGAETSGHVVLYDAGGRLLFSGGITPARGETGASQGRRALTAALQGKAIESSTAPVYGCPLVMQVIE